MRYILLLAIMALASCGQKKGCTNEWSNNYDHEAIVDCCCDFNLEAIIADIIGTYQIQEQCSGDSSIYEVIISRDADNLEGIEISNFNNSGYSNKATWNEDEFALRKNWVKKDCIVTTTGSVHKASGKIYFVYAAFPENSCEDTKGITCEARSIL